MCYNLIITIFQEENIKHRTMKKLKLSGEDRTTEKEVFESWLSINTATFSLVERVHSQTT